jgi:hypothetical protein
MQDEVTKHTRKIYHVLKTPGHSITEKVKEVIIEIFIIVFAVTLSIWFHNWSDYRHEQREVREFLNGLKEDLTKDVQLLDSNRSAVTRLDSAYHFLYSLSKNDAAGTVSDTMIYKSLYFDLRFTHANVGRYQGFKSSGKMGTIENDSLKENILVFYEQKMSELEYDETFVNGLQSKILDLQFDKSDKLVKDLVTSPKMKSLLNITIQNFENNINQYNDVAAFAKRIIAQIDGEEHK